MKHVLRGSPDPPLEGTLLGVILARGQYSQSCSLGDSSDTAVYCSKLFHFRNTSAGITQGLVIYNVVERRPSSVSPETNRSLLGVRRRETLQARRVQVWCVLACLVFRCIKSIEIDFLSGLPRTQFVLAVTEWTWFHETAACISTHDNRIIDSRWSVSQSVSRHR